MPPRARGRVPRPGRARLGLEALEDRILLAAWAPAGSQPDEDAASYSRDTPTSPGEGHAAGAAGSDGRTNPAREAYSTSEAARYAASAAQMEAAAAASRHHLAEL